MFKFNLDKLKVDAAIGFPIHDDDRDALIKEVERLRRECDGLIENVELMDWFLM